MTPTSASPAGILVLGAGVIGLTSAIRLREAGYRVRIVTKARTPKTTSDVAAAFWYPFHIEGPSELLHRCATHTYDALNDLRLNRQAGITMVAGRSFFEQELTEEEMEREYWWRRIPQIGFRELSKQEIPTTHHFQCGFGFTVPVVHMPTYLQFLEDRFTKILGGVIEEQEVTFSDLASFARNYECLVNCTGLEARNLLRDDKMFPSKGEVLCIRPRDNWRTLVFVTQGDLAPLYIVPRGEHDILLGGCTLDDVDDDLPTTAMASNILGRCAKVFPEFGDLTLQDAVIEHRAARRPCRHDSVRLETEQVHGKPIVHCYGHGGAGVTLSWGSAEEVVRLVHAQV